MTSPVRWLLLSVRCSEADVQPLVAEALLALGGSAVEERGDALLTYLPPPADPEALAARVQRDLRDELPGVLQIEVHWEWRANEDWALTWKRGLQPRRVTSRLIVKPTWAEFAAAPGEVVIDIDPQMAFGTGEHATTRGCLRLLDAALVPGDRVLDVGSGSAILAIAAARLGAAQVVAVEADADANSNARENIARNGVGPTVTLVEALAESAWICAQQPFDLILANILSGVIRPLLPAFAAHLRPAGRLIVSGILQTEHEAVVRDAAAAGFRLERVDTEDEWWSALLTLSSAP